MKSFLLRATVYILVKRVMTDLIIGERTKEFPTMFPSETTDYTLKDAWSTPNICTLAITGASNAEHLIVMSIYYSLDCIFKLLKESSERIKIKELSEPEK